MSNSDKIENVGDAYEKAKTTLEGIIENPNATDKQVDKAQAAYDAVFVKYGDTLIIDINKRAKVLQTLIDELEKVIQEIQLNPIGDALSDLNDVIEYINEGL